ncbi:SOS response-associated peptidase [Actinomycetospora termitidis]|uniref:Abasic site processing protein n=1 Tax=Actinomycetospora termitidis TaxID=3053470 RepID=A0ABT7M916_9PSEU|nr:SOS response-associated peptidase [Actinomycetospora sp. Odt1-22]MDL5157165.1 SOS response-associated peptidase [Actinomycetospora sp. Odt1-22]
MCGRYALAKDPADLAEEFDARDATDGTLDTPEYNVAPTLTIPGVVDRHPRDEDGTPDPASLERSVRAMKWGLVPSWAKDPSVGNRMINARGESLLEKPAFRKAAASRRCLLPADGWFEWLRDGKQKTPYFMTFAADSTFAGRSLALAGLWETWRPERGADPLVSTTVVTIDSAGPLTEIHHRMPLVLPPDRWADWLDPENDDPTGLLAPSEEILAAIEMRQVSSKVNNVRNHGAELIEEDHEQPEQQGLDLESVNPS